MINISQMGYPNLYDAIYMSYGAICISYGSFPFYLADLLGKQSTI